jgi:5'-nucleotidase (lipoprotein e(P4) family)
MRTSTVAMRLRLPALFILLTAACATKQPPHATPSLPLRETHEQLQPTLWAQTAAEYQVLATGAYERAVTMFDRANSDRSWTAAIEQEELGGFSALPVAVVMDLDETVLDNSRAQGQFVLDRTPYLPRTWSEWVSLSAAGEVPGAKAFIEHVRRSGAQVIFVTNRTIAEEPATVKNLTDILKIPTTAEDVMCVGENGWTSDKSIRRRFIAGKYRIALLAGDDLGDFVSIVATKSPEDRVGLAMRHQSKWRDRWVLLPNPMYGSWDRILTPGLTDDAEVLRKKRETVKGFRNPPSR